MAARHLGPAVSIEPRLLPQLAPGGGGVAFARIDRAARRAPGGRPVVRNEAEQQHAAGAVHQQDARGGAGRAGHSPSSSG